MSIVIPTRNRSRGLEAVVRRALADPAAAELIVVDDGSADGSRELLERLAADEPRVRAVSVEGLGEMGARAAGAEQAEGDVVLFLDDDVLAESGLAAGHARCHAAGERRVVVGYMPVRLPPRRRPGEFAARIYSADSERHCERCEREPAVVLTNLWAGNFSMRRADCLAVGMRNPAYTERYHPDREFGLRCLEAGLTGVFERSLRAAHLYERTPASFARDARSQGAAVVLLHRLHPGALGPLELEALGHGLPRPLRALVRALAAPRMYPSARSALRLLVAAAGALRLWSLEEDAARLLRRVEQRRGAMLAW